jgi:hypothetical protein
MCSSERKEEAAGEYHTHSEELRNLYTSSNILALDVLRK